MVRVLIADDSVPFREVLRDVVLAAPGMEVAGEARSGEDAVEAAGRLAPDLLIMDKRMPGGGGIEAARLIRARHPEVVVVLVSVESPRDVTLEAGGAHAFL